LLVFEELGVSSLRMVLQHRNVGVLIHCTIMFILCAFDWLKYKKIS